MTNWKISKNGSKKWHKKENLFGRSSLSTKKTKKNNDCKQLCLSFATLRFEVNFISFAQKSCRVVLDKLNPSQIDKIVRPIVDERFQNDTSSENDEIFDSQAAAPGKFVRPITTETNGTNVENDEMAQGTIQNFGSFCY